MTGFLLARSAVSTLIVLLLCGRAAHGQSRSTSRPRHRHSASTTERGIYRERNTCRDQSLATVSAWRRPAGHQGGGAECSQGPLNPPRHQLAAASIPSRWITGRPPRHLPPLAAQGSITPGVYSGPDSGQFLLFLWLSSTLSSRVVVYGGGACWRAGVLAPTPVLAGPRHQPQVVVVWPGWRGAGWPGAAATHRP